MKYEYKYEIWMRYDTDSIMFKNYKIRYGYSMIYKINKKN